MKILVEIAAEHYDQMMDQIARESRLYSILKNGIVVYDQPTPTPRKVIKVFCEKSDAGIILDATKAICSEATEAIEQSIALSRTL